MSEIDAGLRSLRRILAETPARPVAVLRQIRDLRAQLQRTGDPGGLRFRLAMAEHAVAVGELDTAAQLVDAMSG